MKKVYYLTVFMLTSLLGYGQSIKLMDHLLYPRLDSTFWEKDYGALNAGYSMVANRCETCVFTQTDSTRGRFCFNTSLGHVQLDTTLHHFTIETIIGEWEVVNYGLFEIKDSLLSDSKVYYRNERILSEQKGPNGYASFTYRHFKTDFNNIREIPNRRSRYKILNGKFLTTRKGLSGFCGATIIGLTADGFLILDDHTYSTLAKKEKYLMVKTTIRRIIMRKSTNT